MLVRMNADFRDKAPVSAAQAATIILDGVRSGAWRILIGEDAKMIDAVVRAKPRPPTTTPNCSARWHKRQRQEHPSSSAGRRIPDFVLDSADGLADWSTSYRGARPRRTAAAWGCC